MRNYILVLLVLFTFQIVIAFTLYFQDATGQADSLSHKLLTLNENDIVRVAIKQDDAELTIVNKEGKWVFKEHQNIPIEAHKINVIESELLPLKVSWPITQTQGSHTRFKVSDESYNKQITFTSADGNMETIFLGDSPEFKQVYARIKGQDNVYSIPFSSFKLTANLTDWFSKSLLAVSEISEVKSSTLSLKKNEKGWELESDKQKMNNELIDENLINTYVEKLNALKVSDIAELSLTSSETISVKTVSGYSYTYEFAKQGDNYYISRNDFTHWFELSKPQYEDIALLQFDKFLLKESEEQEEIISE
ncbi:DUF4340 domain-containing protein [Pseudoalteromonas sp.]|uniref:DUF4340 domain-containing protein n=1 Tax=Pseudoalteromonas sp. TaxID=53249 RepID=UPI0035688CE0